MAKCTLCDNEEEFPIWNSNICYCKNCALILNKQEGNNMSVKEVSYDNTIIKYDDEEPIDIEEFNDDDEDI